MSWNGLVQGYAINVAFWLVIILAILRFTFTFPWQVWILVVILSPVIAFGVWLIEESFGEPVANRLVLTGVVVALLFVADKYGGPFSRQTWLVALSLWLLIAVTTARLRGKTEPNTIESETRKWSI